MNNKDLKASKFYIIKYRDKYVKVKDCRNEEPFAFVVSLVEKSKDCNFYTDLCEAFEFMYEVAGMYEYIEEEKGNKIKDIFDLFNVYELKDNGKEKRIKRCI